MTDIMEKYYEDSYKTGFGEDKEELFYISGKNNDYRIVVTTIGVYDEEYENTGIESIGIGAYVELHEILDNRSDILEYIKKSIDDYEFENFDGMIYNTYPAKRESIQTYIESSPEDAESLVTEMLTILEKVA